MFAKNVTLNLSNNFENFPKISYWIGKNFVLLVKLFGARAHVKARGHVQTAFPIEATFMVGDGSLM